MGITKRIASKETEEFIKLVKSLNTSQQVATLALTDALKIFAENKKR